MNGTTDTNTSDTRGALRDLLQLHFGSHAWLPALLMAVSVGMLAILLSTILTVGPGLGYIPPSFRVGLAYKTVACWVLSTISAYVSGFIMGRLYIPRS